MVIHDTEKKAQWVEQRHRQPKPPKEKKAHPLSLLAIQSLACTVILLVALLFRVAGGTAYTQLQQGFTRALAGNELMTVLMRWWDKDSGATPQIGEEGDVKEESFTSPSALIQPGLSIYA